MLLQAAHSWVFPLALPVAVHWGAGRGQGLYTTQAEVLIHGSHWCRASSVAEAQGLGGDWLTAPEPRGSRVHFLDNIKRVDWVTGSLGINYALRLYSKCSSCSLGIRHLLGTSVGIY